MEQAAPEISEETGRDSTLVSRNICICGRRTSVRLEPDMWSALREIAEREGCRVHDVCTLVHLRKCPGSSLTAAIRVFIMLYYKVAATEEGHARAGHGDFDSMILRAKMTRDVVTMRRGREVSA
jgi:predicted DNA-binding ribbon-helix-helix protein